MNIMRDILKVKKRRFRRPLEVALGPRSCVSISRRPPSIVQQQVSIKNTDVVCDGAFLLQSTTLSALVASLFPLCCSDPISFPPLQTASEWWYLTVVDSLEKAPRQKPCRSTSCHLPVGRNRTPRKSYWQQLLIPLSMTTNSNLTPIKSNTLVAILRSKWTTTQLM